MLTYRREARIEWGDCDPAGIVFFPRYFAMFDSCTTALFSKALGMSKYQFTRHYKFEGYPMVDTRARFLKPTKFGDDVVIGRPLQLLDAGEVNRRPGSDDRNGVGRHVAGGRLGVRQRGRGDRRAGGADSGASRLSRRRSRTRASSLR